ncbi:uncharacterized protein LOC109720753 isoform X1 [Ananas comosus]|uniref:holo-[acyl-carrier-protein] synthase n=1 Tax=Ananas comosus TaxID=4615 RepID=A0A6P5G4Y5_ANACO|nr:uncharacterized protein LOC109720753 isoform X1 [Ananas comosus]
MNQFIRRGMLPMQGGVLSHRLFASLPPLTPSPLPSRREAHLWYVVPDELKDASQLKKYMELLSSCERERVLSMNGERLQKGALLSRALVRTTLARYCRVNPQSIKFKTSKFGKPEIMWQHGDQCNQPSLQFNVSHSSSLIACGITVDVPIGIDVEEKQRKTMSSISSLARRYFSPSEVEYLGSFSNTDARQKEFIKLWTLKEAYVKALGRGFSGAPFKDFTIRLEATKAMQLAAVPRVHIEADSDPEYLTDNWEFALFELSSSHYAAVCMERDISHSGRENEPLRLKVWKTIPFVEDEFVSGTNAVKYICGLS